MGSKAASAIITFLISIVVAVVVLFMMLIVMNGYSESDATWGLGAFIMLSLIAALAGSAGAFAFAGVLLRRQFRPLVAAGIAVPVCSLAVIGVQVVASLIGIAIAEYVRVHY